MSAALLLALSFIWLGALTTWARESLVHAHRNQPQSTKPSPAVAKAIELWKDRRTSIALGLARFFSSTAATLILFNQLDNWGLWIWLWGALLILATYFIVGLIPQILAKLFPYKGLDIAVALAKISRFYLAPLLWFHRQSQQKILGLWGIDSRLGFLTDEELARIADNSQNDPSQDGLDDEEKQMIRNIFEWGDTPVQEVMTPRGEMICLNLDKPLEETIKFINDERLSRIPVYDDNLDNIIGILHAKDFFHWYSSRIDDLKDLRPLLRPPLVVDRSSTLSELMTQFRRTKTHLAILIDEYGGTVGLVTLEDLIEEIVGEIYDEDDEQESLVREVRSGIFLADTTISLDDLADTLARPISIDDELGIDTLSGLLQWKLGAQPRKAAVVDYEGMRIKVLKIEESRATSVLIELKPNSLN